MQLTEHLYLMAKYNQWMNTQLYEAALKLSTKEPAKNRGGFFGSIIGTLNYWMPYCLRLSTNCYAYRQIVNNLFSELARFMIVTKLKLMLSYRNTKSIASTKNLFSLLMHVFNHQTHHRRQVTNLLSQAGVYVGVTDLVAIIHNAVD